MATTSKSRTTSKASVASPHVQRRVPTHRPPTHPSEMLLQEFLKPLDIWQSAFAIQPSVSFPRLNEASRIARLKPLSRSG